MSMSSSREKEKGSLHSTGQIRPRGLQSVCADIDVKVTLKCWF